ncbi:MAG: hypothetical protein AAFY65_06135 [Pseudomonadota bacterium]
MRRLAVLLSVGMLVTACGGGDDTGRGAGGPDRISLLFAFPQGSRCTVAAGAGVLTQDQMPGRLEFPMSEQAAPVRCILPDGRTVDVRAHRVVPRTAEGRTDITVYPDGRASITMFIAGREVQMAPTGTVQPI